MRTGAKLALAASALLAATGVGFSVGQAQEHQPHMQMALDALRSARHELQTAMRNKGGHRIRAIELVNQAIDEVKAGIDAGDPD